MVAMIAASRARRQQFNASQTLRSNAQKLRHQFRIEDRLALASKDEFVACCPEVAGGGGGGGEGGRRIHLHSMML
jgi:hypothetical protein